MKLFLASQGNDPESLKKLDNFLGKSLAKFKITYVPTAANGDGFGSWKRSDTLKTLKKLGAKIEIVELENLNFQDVITPIRQADILWVGGGMSGYLLYWVRRTKLDQFLPEILQKTIYVGSSAGSMICGPTNYAASRFPGDEEFGAEVFPGLGFIDFEIAPHFEESQFPIIEKFWKKGKLCLLKNGEAITVVDRKVTILGEERFIEK